jgi:hypothetical protein
MHSCCKEIILEKGLVLKPFGFESLGVCKFDLNFFFERVYTYVLAFFKDNFKLEAEVSH